MTPDQQADQVLALHDAVMAALQAQPNLDVLDGAVDDAGQPTYRLDGDGRVHMTAVLWMGAGSRYDTGQDALCGDRDLTPVTFQVSCVGGDANRSRRAALKVRAALTGKYLIPGSSRCTEQLDPVNPRPDATASPARYVTPMLYQLDLNQS